MSEKLRNGWTYGIPLDDADKKRRKVHSCLLPWNDSKLVAEQEKDRSAMRAIPKCLAVANYEIA